MSAEWQEFFSGLTDKLSRKVARFIRGADQPIPVDVLTGYAKWAENYPAQAHNALMRIEQETMLDLLATRPTNAVCLDLACGSGRYMRLMQQRRAQSVFGLDISPEMLWQASADGLGGYLARGPLSTLPFPDKTFDLITCGLGIGHEKKIEQSVGEAARVLRCGGSLLYSDIHPFGALSGWQRTFCDGGQATYALEHYAHLYGAHQNACHQAGLTIQTVCEPEDPARRQVPVVMVILAVKSG